MILYHGSSEAVSAPMILITKYTKDFSWGFYATENFSQAEKWAYRKAQLGGTPTVNVYEYTEDPGLGRLSFSDTTKDWLDFVAHCRRGELHQYDISDLVPHRCRPEDPAVSGSKGVETLP